MAPPAKSAKSARSAKLAAAATSGGSSRATRTDKPPASGELLRLLGAVEHGMQSASKLMAKDGGVTGPQRSVLRAIARQPGLSASAVADFVQLHASTVTGILQRLIERGLVVRERSDADARKAALHVTELGKKASEARAGSPEGAVRRALARLAPADVECALRALEALAEELARH